MDDATRLEPTVADLVAAARSWAAGDPDVGTATALAAVADAAERGDPDARAELVAALVPPIAFGTAGLRGPVGPGPARMNRATVLRTTWAVAAHVRAAAGDGAEVVVAFDARPDSARFADDVVGVLVAAGLRVALWPEPTPTPLAAWAGKERAAAATIVVTASHNPPADNGVKLYGPDAIQIVPPTDVEVAGLIDTAPAAAEVPRHPDPHAAPEVTLLGPEDEARYRAAVVDAVASAPAPPAQVRLVHTALHGVGARVVRAVLAEAGHLDLHEVASQAEPDGAFPTVAFPNPEEPGALDAALALARELDADLVLANDPDADRVAVAAPDGAGGWTALTGNEVAVLLADDLLGRREVDRPLVVSSIVSTPWLDEVVAAHGARSERTLTGFKWICTAAAALEAEGATPVLGTEEALGYAIGTLVRDKDGISAALAVADLAARLAAEGRTVAGALDDLRRRTGAWASVQHSVVRTGVTGAADIAAAVDAAATLDLRELAGHPVTARRDLREGAADRPRWLPAADLVELTLVDGRALIRPSGTEPKCKVYVDLRGEDPADVQGVRREALAVARALAVAVGLEA
ncbi:MAG: phospho-sugar mutase [Actinomycetes bacterium]